MKKKKLITVLLITYLIAFADGFCCNWLLRNRKRLLSCRAGAMVKYRISKIIGYCVGLAGVVLVCLPLVFTNTAFAADQQQTAALTVIVYNCENQSGHVVARLFSAQDAKAFGFEKNGAIERIGKIDSSNSSKVVYEKLPFGDYALSVFHDYDDSRNMEKTLFGLYKKRYGFSGGASKANFDLAKFSFNRDQVIYITLR
ncbi:MAG: DUF2141 domain-containing protein [Negativicutes bacterium]|jgi:uncharacterized protein (DUF2141 family)